MDDISLGTRPTFSNGDTRKRLLDFYAPPRHIIGVVEKGGSCALEVMIRVSRIPSIASPLSVPSPDALVRSIDAMRALLFCEEGAVRAEMQTFNPPGAVMRSSDMHPTLASIPMKDLSERRPSVLVGDSVRVQSDRLPMTHVGYLGYVHLVASEAVLVDFGAQIATFLCERGEDIPITVEVIYNTRSEKIYHDAINRSYMTWRLLMDQRDLPPTLCEVPIRKAKGTSTRNRLVSLSWS